MIITPTNTPASAAASAAARARKPRELPERDIQNEIMRVFGTRSDMRLWRSNVVVAHKGGRTVRSGIVGQADLSGIIAGGIRLEIEVKSPTGRQSPEQAAWQKMIERFGGIYVLARSVEDVWAALIARGVIR